MRRLLVIPLLLIIVFGIVLGACGGGSGNNNATPTPGSSGTTTPGTPGPTGTPVPDPFAALQSYRYDMELLADGTTSIKIIGIVKAPDSIRMDFYMADTTAPISSLIIVGQQAWAQSQGDTEWTPMDIAEARERADGPHAEGLLGHLPHRPGCGAEQRPGLGERQRRRRQSTIR